MTLRPEVEVAKLPRSSWSQISRSVPGRICLYPAVIERLKESSGGVIGFKLRGRVSVEDEEEMEKHIKFLIQSRRKRPIGILAHLAEMDSIDLAARWQEIRFLQKWNDHIGRMAVVGAHPWEKVSSLFVVAAALLQSETLYFHESEMAQAWQWVRTSKHALEPAPPRISAASGVWKDYHSEYMDV